jgi:hypothetical protein
MLFTQKGKQPHRDTEGNSEIVHGINSPISRAEIIDAIQTASSNTAPRADNIPNELLKKGGVAIVSILHKLLNIICLREAPSTIWERDLIRPLYKTKDPLLTENYRDTTLTNAHLHNVQTISVYLICTSLIAPGIRPWSIPRTRLSSTHGMSRAGLYLGIDDAGPETLPLPRNLCVLYRFQIGIPIHGPFAYFHQTE